MLAEAFNFTVKVQNMLRFWFLFNCGLVDSYACLSSHYIQDVEDMVVGLILDGRIRARIDSDKKVC